jgi:hypothetical protein
MLKGDIVADGEHLLRRAYRKDKKYVHPTTGLPTSRAFAPSPKDEGKLSVDIKSLTNFTDSIKDEQRFRLFGLMVSVVYKLKLKCTYDPVLPENPAHAIITGFDPEDESIPGILARNAREVTSRTWNIDM